MLKKPRYVERQASGEGGHGSPVTPEPPQDEPPLDDMPLATDVERNREAVGARLRRDLKILSEEELAATFGVGVRTLRNWRVTRIGPPWVTAGKTTLYRLESIIGWLGKMEERSPGPDPRL